MNKSTLEEQIRRHLGAVNASELDWLVFDIMDVAEDYANQRAIEELEDMQENCIGHDPEDPECEFLKVDIQKRIEELKQK